MKTIAISELQKSPKKALASTQGVTYILSNNDPAGGLVDNRFLEFLELEGVWDWYEDWQLSQDEAIVARSVQSVSTLKGDLSDTLTLEQL